MKFCFICGKKTEKLIEGYCEDCYNKNYSLIKIPKEINVIKCSKCDRFKSRNAWIDGEIEDLIKNDIKILGGNVKIRIEGNKIFATGFLRDSKKSKEETCETNIKIKKILCPNCSKKLGDYFESTIQLRGDVTEEILDFIDEKFREKTFYKIERVKGGLNLCIGNKNIANQVAEELKRRYTLEIKKSFKLFTKKDGKDVYKCTILIRCD